jgi:hypothetical protein
MMNPLDVFKKIKFRANAYEPDCDLVMIFPDLESTKIHYSYKHTPNLISTIRHHIDRLSSIRGIKIILKDIFKDE